jgi:hypothetical protein
VLLWYAKVDDTNSFFDNVSWWQVYIPGGGNTLRLKCVNAQQALAVKTLDITNAELNIYDNAWHFLCVRFNGTNMEFMVDGMKKDIWTSQWTSAPAFHVQKIGIGCDPQGFSRSSNLYLDELRCDRIYLPDQEVEAWKASDRPFYDPYDYSITESTPG